MNVGVVKKHLDDTIEEVRRGVAVTHSHIASVARKGTVSGPGGDGFGQSNSVIGVV